jgi:hypothetical protein
MKKRELALETTKNVIIPVITMVLIIILPFSAAGLI